MDETALNHRLYDHHAVLRFDLHGCRTTSHDWEKKGSIKDHTVIHANEGVPSDIRFNSTVTNDSFMLKLTTLDKGYPCADIDYEKFPLLTERSAIYVTGMKKNLRYSILSDTMYRSLFYLPMPIRRHQGLAEGAYEMKK